MREDTILTIRATVASGVYRDIELAGSASLYKLAEAINHAYGFAFDHAFGFYSTLRGNYYHSPVKYELFADMGEPTEGARSVKKTTVAEAYPEDKAKLLFMFDYGDEWHFQTERLGSGSKIAKVRYPRVAKSKGEAPEQYPDYEE
jgi:hypothetical protein